MAATLEAPRKGDLVIKVDRRISPAERRPVTDITLGIASATNGTPQVTMWAAPATAEHQPNPKPLRHDQAQHVSHLPAGKVDVPAAMSAYRQRTAPDSPFIAPFTSDADLHAFLLPFLH